MSKKIVLASTSSLFGKSYLEYLIPSIKELFDGIEEIIFIPFARPGGISHDEYTRTASDFFKPLGIKLTGLHTYHNMDIAIRNSPGFFTGGGNTFLLVKQLHENGLMKTLKNAAEGGRPYLGTSAGSNIGGINMQTTNDMPIVYPPDFNTMSLVPFNINPHYSDPVPGLTHMGETRETRIKEFHAHNNIPVVGLREGSWIAVNGESITLEGTLPARIFEQGKDPYEIPTQSKLSFN